VFHADGRTNRHDEANSRSSKICERTKLSELAMDCVCVCVCVCLCVFVFVCVCIVTCDSRTSVAVLCEWTIPSATSKGSGNVALSKEIDQCDFRNL